MKKISQKPMSNFGRKKFAHLPSQLCIFVFTFMIKSFHIYEALLHVRLKVLTFTRPYYIFTFGPQREKTCLRGFANNTGADQPAHPRSLISAFVIRFLESVICKLATGDISTF